MIEKILDRVDLSFEKTKTIPEFVEWEVSANIAIDPKVDKESHIKNLKHLFMHLFTTFFRKVIHFFSTE